MESDEEIKGNNEEVGSPLYNPKNLQKQFTKATQNQAEIKRRYKELWSWHGTKNYHS